MPSLTAIDPVCGMETDPAAVVEMVEVAGRSYYFCESACAETFRDEPERWIPAEAVDDG